MRRSKTPLTPADKACVLIQRSIKRLQEHKSKYFLSNGFDFAARNAHKIDALNALAAELAAIQKRINEV